MSEKFDLIIIGTGSAATTVAFPCRAGGLTVAVIDSREFGGTCALRGCDPKKVLVGAVDLLDGVHRMEKNGLDSNGVKLNWPELMRFKRTFTEPFPGRIEKELTEAEITAFHGRAFFIAPDSIRVGEKTLTGKNIVIATGAKPVRLNIPGEELILTSDDFLDFDEIPREITFVGGGYIAFEFAHIAARAGAKVKIVHRGRRPLEHFDPDLIDKLVERTQSLGIEVHLETQVVGVEKNDNGFLIRVLKAGEEIALTSDAVIHAAGRSPDLEDLDLAAGGVEFEKQGVKVNQFLQSVSNRSVYAVGDAAASGLPLTSIATYEGNIVAENILNGNQSVAEYPEIPSVVFTIPPVATVGLQESEAREQGLKFDANLMDTSGWYSARRIGEKCSAAKILIEKDTGFILGAHLLGHHAEEVINIFALAIRHKIPAADLKKTIYAYPTNSSDVRYML